MKTSSILAVPEKSTKISPLPAPTKWNDDGNGFIRTDQVTTGPKNDAVSQQRAKKLTLSFHWFYTILPAFNLVYLLAIETSVSGKIYWKLPYILPCGMKLQKYANNWMLSTSGRRRYHQKPTLTLFTLISINRGLVWKGHCVEPIYRQCLDRRWLGNPTPPPCGWVWSELGKGGGEGSPWPGNPTP